MAGLIATVIAAMTAFAATNIDDIVILMLLFSQENASFPTRHIVVGQYLGFAVLLLVSLPSFFGGMVISKPWIGLLGFVPIAIGIIHLRDNADDDADIQTINASSPKLTPFTRLLHPQVFQVAAITVANGGDNIGIYVPLFASSNLISLSIILIVFALLIGVWCFVAYQLTRHRAIAPILTRYTKRIVPFVLIGLGLYILFENGSYQLLSNFR